MGKIRPFVRDEIPEVVRLHRQSFGRHPRMSEAELAAYFAEMFFEHPWYDEACPSLVLERDGGIQAFLGVFSRPMRFRGDPIRAAVVSQLMADPERCPPLGPLKLVKELFAGPQDLSLTDGAHRGVEKLWVGSGGSSTPLYDFHWSCAIRPVGQALKRAEGKSRGFRWGARAATPVAFLADLAVARILRAVPVKSEQIETVPLKPGMMLQELSRIGRRFPLAPDYDEDSLTWIIEQARRKTRFGPLRSMAVLDSEGGLLGWHIRYQAESDDAETVQIYARPGNEDTVFRSLLSEARQLGATSVRGRNEPSFAMAAARARAGFAPEGAVTLCHSRRPDVLAALQGGKAFFTRLEGEWWQRFAGG